jgi:hypothetical protein
MSRDVRGQVRREREWLAREATQRCQICGRRFAMRAEKICSQECLEKLEAQAKQKAKTP